MSFRLEAKVLTGASAEALSSTDLMVNRAIVQVKRSNSNKMEIAPESFTTGAGYELLAPAANEKLAEYIIESQPGAQGINLAKWYILGTAGEGVNIIAEEF